MYPVNGDLEYNLVIFGWGSQGFVAWSSEINSEMRPIVLETVDYSEWKDEISSRLGNLNQLGEAIDYQEFVRKDNERKNTNQAKRDLQNRLLPIVFPCQQEDSETVDQIAIIDEVTFNNFRNNPTTEVVPVEFDPSDQRE